MKARCSPCSRRLATHPHTVTVDPRPPPEVSAQPRAHGGGLVRWSDASQQSFRGRGPIGGPPTRYTWIDRRRDRLGRPPPPPRSGAPSLLPVPRRGRRVTVPAARSSGPTISATGAPERSAGFIWDFIDRPSKARSASSPARRSAAVRSRAASPRPRPPRRRRGRAGRRQDPLGVTGHEDPLDAEAEPDARCGGTPSISTSPS